MYIKIASFGALPERYSIAQLCQDNPQVSFPEEISIKTLARFGVYPLQATEPPAFNHATQNLVESVPVQEDDQWVQSWAVVPASEQEIADRLVAQAEFVRQQRNQYLDESDWTQVLDAPIDATERQVWSAYRQALRDVTAQSGFPWTIDWPTAP